MKRLVPVSGKVKGAVVAAVELVFGYGVARGNLPSFTRSSRIEPKPPLPMLRSLLALMIGWCVLAIASFLAGYDGAHAFATLLAGFGSTAGAVLPLVPMVVVMAESVKRWPRLRRKGVFLLPLLGAVIAYVYASWLDLELTAGVPPLLALFCGAALGFVAEHWLPGAPAETEAAQRGSGSMMRALLALMIGWCLLGPTAAVSYFREYSVSAALFYGFRLPSLIVLMLVPAVIVFAASATRWPWLRRAGVLAMPLFGGVIAWIYASWLEDLHSFEVDSFLAIFCGGALGFVAERWLPAADWTEHGGSITRWLRELLDAKLRDLDDANLCLPPRIVTGLCLVQIIAVCVGSFATRGAIHHYSLSGMFGSFYHPRGILVFISSFGFWFLLVPLFWCGWAVRSANRDGGTADIAGRQALLGIFLAGFSVVFFGWCALAAVLG